jgi:putative endonuclease
MKGYMYILECCDGSYYTGSTKDLELRMAQHQAGEGANHTKKRLPVKLVYYEEYQRIDEAFYREKQVQGWSRKKKEALINGDFENLSPLSMAYRDIKANSSDAKVASRTSATDITLPEALPLPVALEGNTHITEIQNNLKGLKYE